MGTRTADTLKEIDELRSGLEAKLNELGTRLPPAVRATRRALGGVAGGVALYAVTRLRLKAKAKAKAKAKGKAGHRKQDAVPSVLVRATGVSAPAALGVAAIWAAVRVWERRSGAGQVAPASVTALRRDRGA